MRDNQIAEGGNQQIVLYRTDFGGSKVKATKTELLKLLELEYNYFIPESHRMFNLAMVRGLLEASNDLSRRMWLSNSMDTSVILRCLLRTYLNMPEKG